MGPTALTPSLSPRRGRNICRRKASSGHGRSGVPGVVSLTKTKGFILASVIVGALALPLTTQAEQQQKKEHPHYKLIDLGTFGGPSSGTGNFYLQFINLGTFGGNWSIAVCVNN